MSRVGESRFGAVILAFPSGRPKLVSGGYNGAIGIGSQPAAPICDPIWGFPTTDEQVPRADIPLKIAYRQLEEQYPRLRRESDPDTCLNQLTQTADTLNKILNLSTIRIEPIEPFAHTAESVPQPGDSVITLPFSGQPKACEEVYRVTFPKNGLLGGKSVYRVSFIDWNTNQRRFQMECLEDASGESSGLVASDYPYAVNIPTFLECKKNPAYNALQVSLVHHGSYFGYYGTLPSDLSTQRNTMRDLEDVGSRLYRLIHPEASPNFLLTGKPAKGNRLIHALGSIRKH